MSPECEVDVTEARAESLALILITATVNANRVTKEAFQYTFNLCQHPDGEAVHICVRQIYVQTKYRICSNDQIITLEKNEALIIMRGCLKPDSESSPDFMFTVMREGKNIG